MLATNCKTFSWKLSFTSFNIFGSEVYLHKILQYIAPALISKKCTWITSRVVLVIDADSDMGAQIRLFNFPDFLSLFIVLKITRIKSVRTYSSSLTFFLSQMSRIWYIVAFQTNIPFSCNQNRLNAFNVF